MLRTTSCLFFTACALHLACSDSESPLAGVGGSGAAAGSGGSAGAGGSSTGNGGAGAGGAPDGGGAAGSGLTTAGAGGTAPIPPPPNVIPDHHLGRPFTLVDGVIRADSNEYALQASFYAIISAAGATQEVTTSSAGFCIHGTVERVAEGPFGGNFSGFGFITGEQVTIEMPGLSLTRNLDVTPELADTYGTSGGIRINPVGPIPWNLGDGRVIGISARVTGSSIPEGPGGQATPGGMDPDGPQSGYGNCNIPGHAAGSDERRAELLFPALHYDCWNAATLPYTAWRGDSVIVFGWGVSSLRVPGIAPGDPIEIPPDPYDFCFSDLRPIVIGAGPDEPAGDAGTSAPDAGDAGG
ncbi:MAG: hypothetical protein RL685_1402 [Pseudomonadota bacterium]|jgi:hypothetical protein